METSPRSSSDETGLEHITLSELLDAAITDRLIDLHVSMPAQVTAYNAATQTVSVTPMLDRHLPDGADGWTSEHLPALSDVPVIFPRGGSFFIAVPIAPGDSGLLLFCERSIAAWRATGQQSDPGDIGLHTLDGAVFLPGLFPRSAALASADSLKLRIGKDGNGPLVEFDPGAGVTITPSLTIRHFLSEQSGGPPSSSDGAHLVIDGSSTDRSGFFTLQGFAPGSSVNVDVSYAQPFPNGSRVHCYPADSAAAQLCFCDNSGSGVGLPMQIYVDAGSTDGSKFKVKNSSLSDKTPAGKFFYSVEGF